MLLRGHYRISTTPRHSFVHGITKNKSRQINYFIVFQLFTTIDFYSQMFNRKQCCHFLKHALTTWEQFFYQQLEQVKIQYGKLNVFVNEQK